jgi:predicted restriction endonuclease
MTSSASNVDSLWTTLEALPRSSRNRFLENVVADTSMRQELEDLLDQALAHQRSNEPVRPLDAVLAEIDEA